VGQAKRFLERQWDEEMGVSGLNWASIAAVPGALTREFKADASVDEVKVDIMDREGRVAGVAWSGVRQMLNNLTEVYEEEGDDLAGLYAIAHASVDGAHVSLAAEVEAHRTMAELDELITRDD
jgi:hypothetical protein